MSRKVENLGEWDGAVGILTGFAENPPPMGGGTVAEAMKAARKAYKLSRKKKYVFNHMMSERWKTCHKVDVARDHLLDVVFHYDCLGRVGSGSSIWETRVPEGSRFTREHLSGLIVGPH
eukprot:1356176-Pyramimonas_sp.AAC.1